MTTTLAVSASTTDTVSVVAYDVDTVQQTTVKDSLTKKRDNIFKRIYRFADKVLSPPRDTNYVDTQDQYNWCAELQLSARFEQFQLDAGEEFNIRVHPRPRVRVGPFFGWRFAFLGYNIDLRSVFSSEDKDLSASVYSAAFGLDLFYRRVGGSYNVQTLTVDGQDYTKQLNGTPFDGINVGMTRVSFYYVMNYKHFSHQAAYSQANRQLRSAGSPLIGVSYAHNRMTMDWDKFYSQFKISNAEYSANVLYGSQRNDEFSFTGGYGYNWVFARNWLLGAELTGSVGYLLQHTATVTNHNEEGESNDLFSTIETFGRKNLAFNGTGRMVLLYNNGPWFYGVQGYVFYYQYGNGLVKTRNLLGSAYMYVGFNF